MISAVFSGKGLKDINQDAVLLKEARTGQGEIFFGAVCDGMGGLQNGESASALAVTALSDWFNYDLPALLNRGFSVKDVEQSLGYEVKKADRMIADYGRAAGKCGTTLAGVLVFRGRYLCVNVGDSRVYRVTEKGIEQITHDQTVVQRLIDGGSLDRRDASSHPERNILLQCLGAGRVPVPEYRSGKYEKGDLFLLCSDGLWHELSPADLHRLFLPSGVRTREELEKAAKGAVEECRRRGERDDISVLAVKTR